MFWTRLLLLLALASVGCSAPSNPSPSEDAGSDVSPAADTSSTPCNNAYDCPAGDVCGGEYCVAAPSCASDIYEPNDSRQKAADLSLTGPRGAADAVLCSDDRDIFTFEVPAAAPDGPPRQLFVALEFSSRQVGLGPVAVEIDGPGGPMGSATSNDRGALEIVADLGPDDAGTYEIAVSSPAGIGAGGIHYTLAAAVQPANIADACEQASQLYPGTTVERGFVDPGGTFTTRCGSSSGAPTDIYFVDVVQKSVLSVALDASTPDALVASIRSSCRRLESEFSCATDPRGSTGLREVVDPGRYFIYVQNADGGEMAPYELSVATESATCTPSDSYCSDSDTSQTCAPSTAEFVTATCERGCQPHSGRCRAARADICQSAPLIRDSRILPIVWGDLEDDFRNLPDNCGSSAHMSAPADGPDAVYRVVVPPDHALTARVEAGQSNQASVYVVNNCAYPSETCVAPNHPNASGYPEARLIHEGDLPRTVLVVVDSSLGTRGTGVLDLSLAPLLCTPGEVRCHQGDVSECTDSRTALNPIEECRFDCADATCQPAPGQSCMDAKPMNDGEVFSARFSDFSNNRNSRIRTCSPGLAARSDYTGGDAFFSVDLAAGELLVASLTTDQQNAAMYILGDCVDHSSHCLWAAPKSDTLQFHAPETGTYYLVVESGIGRHDDFFSLRTDIVPNSNGCQPGGATCYTATDELVVCDETGTTVQATYQCADGCAGQYCHPPAGTPRDCQSAPTIDASPRLLDYFVGDEDNFFGPDSGADRVYAVELSAGEVLDVTLEATSFARLFLASDCRADVEARLASDQGGSRRAHLRYASPVDQTVYLFAEAVGLTGYRIEPYALTVDIGPRNCQAGEAFCDASGSLARCVDGLLETYACRGGCANARCGAPRGDICRDAIEVRDGQTVSGDFSGTDALELHPPQPGACSAFAAPQSYGVDTFYRIDLQAGDLLEVELLTERYEAAVYFVPDCLDDSRCVPGTQPHGRATAHYRAKTAESIYIVVDSPRGAPSRDSFTLSVDVTPGTACAPHEQYCTAGGQLAACGVDINEPPRRATCPSGCVRGGCSTDVANADTCARAPSITGDIFSTYLDFDELGNDVDLSAATCFHTGADYSDAAYRVDMAAGEVLHVRADTLRGSPTIAIVDDCASIASSCLAGSSSDSDVYWSAREDQTVTVLVEANPAAAPASVLIEKLPPTCTPGARRCSADGRAFEACNAHFRWERQPCPAGCTQARCNPPAGDQCVDAVDATSGGLFKVEPYWLTNTFEQIGLGCADISEKTTGGDAVYRVDMQAGQTLTASLTPNVYGRPALYLLGTCPSDDDSNSEHCLVGDHHSYSGSRALVEWTSPTARTVYLVADSLPHPTGFSLARPDQWWTLAVELD